MIGGRDFLNYASYNYLGLNGDPRIAAAAKAAIDNGLDVDLATGLKLETQLFAGTFATEDQKIGMRSFIENGPGKARFTGN